MQTRADAIAACLVLPDAYEDYPFDDPGWTVMRHKTNKKSFAFIYEREGKIWINLKAEPMMADFWKSAFAAVVPAYHMNKTHWVSVILDGSMQDDEVMQLIRDSYHLTQRKGHAKKAEAEPHGPAPQNI